MERAQELYNKIKKRGISAIDEFILERKAEELFLDFKRSADDGKGKSLHQNDRNNLAKAISGFGNSEGGVIVWGIDCSKNFDGADVAKTKHPIENVDRFVSLLQGVISGCTIPPHHKVENYGMKEQGKDPGFVVTLIPKSMNVPHQSLPNYHYYMRAGSSFVPVPHSVLSGMFGRRPQPKVGLMFSITPAKIDTKNNGDKEVICRIGLVITNFGLSIARDTFFNALVYKGPGPKCKIAFVEQPEESMKDWRGHFAYGVQMSIICREYLKIPPKDFEQPLILRVFLLPPFNNGFEIIFRCGCEGAEVYEQRFSSSKDNIEKYYNEILNLNTEELEESQRLVSKLLGHSCFYES